MYSGGMKRTLMPLASLPILLVACGSARTVSAPAESPASTPDTATAHAAAAAGAKLSSNIPSLPLRAPGDFVVFRFSGKLKQHPVTLTERVVALQDDATTIDYTLEDGATKQTMRVRTVGDGVEQKVASAAWMDGEIEGPVPTSAFDAFLAKTFVSTDANSGVASSEKATVSVGGRAIDCTKTTYKVMVGKKDATMTVLESDTFSWGDVGGEIHAADGSLLYKAELVSEGNAASAEAVVAQQSP
jgi:hypothetical protein